MFCRWPLQKYKYFCPSASIKFTAKQSAENEVDHSEENLGALGHDYDIMLHFTLAHMRRVDGALQARPDGTKLLNLLTPAGKYKEVPFQYRTDGLP